jgi:hypothetical protein
MQRVSALPDVGEAVRCVGIISDRRRASQPGCQCGLPPPGLADNQQVALLLMGKPLVDGVKDLFAT